MAAAHAAAAPMIDPEDDDAADIRRMAEANNPKSRKPSAHPFKQQALKAWKPVLSPSNVVPTFFGVGALFAVIGGALLGVTSNAGEMTVDYTQCNALDESGAVTSQSCADLLDDFTYRSPGTPYRRCQCDVSFSVSGFSGTDTFLYYGLTKYYQNQRRYANSRDDLQLRSLTTEVDNDCDPLATSGGRNYAPCGLIANSLFNDTIQIFDAAGAQVQLLGDAIAWKSDLDVKFANPEVPEGGTLCDADAFSNETSQRPPNWWIPACQLGAGNSSQMCTFADQNQPNSGCSYNPWSSYFGSSGVGYQNEDFIVWMRTAILPTFRKLWRRIPGGLPDGTYVARIGYNYPVKAFDGTKTFQLGTTTGLGGKSTFLPSTFLAFGLIMCVVGGVFVVMWKSSYYGIRVADTRSVQINAVASNTAFEMD